MVGDHCCPAANLRSRIARNFPPRFDESRRGIITPRINSVPPDRAYHQKRRSQGERRPAGFRRLNCDTDR